MIWLIVGETEVVAAESIVVVGSGGQVYASRMTSNIPDSVAVRARWVLPIDQPPLADGLVTIAGGRIAAVGENLSGGLPRDLGDVALLPGLVNAHTHLEFSSLDVPLGEPRTRFSAWIRQVIDYRRQTEALQSKRQTAVARGLAESQAAGVALLGEIATPGWPAECFAAQAVEAVVFLELLGLAPERQEPLLALAQEHLAQQRQHVGLSPHAPYTVGPDLLARLCVLSANRQVPVAMHLAESLDELELLLSHSGELVELLQSLGAWRPDVVPRGIRPLDYLEILSHAHRSLVVHGNFLGPEELQFLGDRRDRMSVVYCPRTFAYFQPGKYPLAAMLAAGMRVAVGTDSRASNPDLRLLEELRQIARQHPEISPEAVLRMGTLAGAEALGLDDRYGSIGVGKSARLAVVPIDAAASDAYEAVLSSTASAAPLANVA
ncbi:MAG: amidohydrolase family protein [Pirellulaceae bacterium]